MPKRITSFRFRPGKRVGQRYVIEAQLGHGTEGEVYQIREVDTGIVRAAKFYFPHRDPDHKISIRHAQKLNTLRYCPIVLQYHHSEVILVQKQRVIALISELCEGKPLGQWISKYRGKRLPVYHAMQLLHSLVSGLETIHMMGEYHADVHTENILIRPQGVKFVLKLIDFYDWGKPARYKQQQDIVDAVRVLYDCLGGADYYRQFPDEVKHIICAMRRNVILKRFPHATSLRRYLESFKWTVLP
jgi:hypothetical protein